jgi:hypothetical protein
VLTQIITMPLIIGLGAGLALLLAIAAADGAAADPANRAADGVLFILFLAASLTLFALIPFAERRQLREQVAKALPRLLGPEEAVVAGAASSLHLESGDWDLVEALRRFRAAKQSPTDAKPYFVLITDQRAVFVHMSGSKLGNEAFSLKFSEIVLTRALAGWGDVRVTIRKPDSSLLLLSFRKRWRADGAQVRDALAARVQVEDDRRP